SGCGKSTLLRLIAGLDRDFSGAIGGVAEATRIAMAFQEPRLLPWRTVEQNIRTGLVPGEDDSHLPALVQSLGLEAHVGFFPGELSLGLARRVALARAFAVKPALLLLDEPFVSLDEPTAKSLRQLLLEVWRARPTTALMVTHNLREAMELADRIIVLSARPATVRGEVALTTERPARDLRWVNAKLAEMETRFAGMV
ncbi:MAG TPA: ATP-binding cassette domain-containing protein, partial [Rhizobiaceae bacterium]|nr:ATP-binding cassette domain-containing protein [Rhizobiaceae bacterium]